MRDRTRSWPSGVSDTQRFRNGTSLTLSHSVALNPQNWPDIAGFFSEQPDPGLVVDNQRILGATVPVDIGIRLTGVVSGVFIVLMSVRGLKAGPILSSRQFTLPLEPALIRVSPQQWLGFEIWGGAGDSGTFQVVNASAGNVVMDSFTVTVLEPV